MSSNIKIVAVEQTQGIQFFNFPAGQGSGGAPDNSIPLVNRKPTILRVYVDAKPNDGTFPVPASVDGILWAFNPNTSGGGVYKSLNGPITARDASTIKRAQSGQTLDFLIPWSVCQDQVLCEIAIFDPNARGSKNSDVHFVTLNFIEVPVLSLHSVLIHYTGVDYFDNPVDAQTTGWDVLFTADYLLRIYPVSDFAFDGCDVLQWSSKLAITANFYALKSTIDNMRALSGTNDVYVGLIPPAAGCGGTCGLGGGGAAIFFVNESLLQQGAAHEIGHALGRAHAPGCLPSTDSGDQNYPQYNGFSRASIGECGVDWRDLVLFDPQTTSDYMSYCKPVWTSPFGYTSILRALQSGAYSPASASALTRDPGDPKGAEYHYINFRVDARAAAEARVTVVSSFHLPRPRPLSYIRPSDVSVELLDDKGAFLYGCASETDPHADNNVPLQYFRAYFPHFPELRRIRIVRRDEVLAEYKVASETPRLSEVTIDHEMNRIRLNWKGNASKGVLPHLEYGVRFSPDGWKWRAVAAATTETELVINTDLLPGGDECRIQIVASAGFRSTVHETKPFSLPKKPRAPYIASPKSGDQFELGTPVTFSGTAFSPNFGVSNPAEVVWTSLAAGRLGIGQQVMTTHLPVGHHWVTMHAPDGAGGLVSKSVDVRVVPPKDGCPHTGPAPIPSEQWKTPCGCG